MTRAGIPASRSNVMRYRRRLVQVQKGAVLLTRKRQSLIEELFARARVAMSSREEIDAHARRAWETLLTALSSSGSDGLAPLGWPTRELDVDVSSSELWGLRVVQLLKRPTIVRSVAARGIVAGPGDAASQDAARAFEILLERLLDVAPQEHLMRRLGDALARTTRLVNTLEQRVAVRLEADLAAMQQTLAEREREEHMRITRLMARGTLRSQGAK
jgi:V/A-type H+-transporting ATPase subunit D